MNILVLGSGAREHVIVEKLLTSFKCKNIYISPGNSMCKAIDVYLPNKFDILNFSKDKDIYMVIVGPEKYLVEGISDFLNSHNIRCFGPSMAASQIEGSKKFSKLFMNENNIPTAKFRCFGKSQIKEAKKYIEESPSIVIKVSGLAGGKGVVLPDSKQEAFGELDKIFLKNKYGTAGNDVVIEERLYGEEVSVFSFCNGKKAFLMPQAQDYKRLYDNDTGPNTGGMGACAPVNVLNTEEIEELQNYMNIVVEKLNYIGVLYTGIMKTSKGFYILEFNCRFGDPETQAVLNLLKSDLFNIFDSCIRNEIPKIEWKNEYVSNVVLAHKLYPGLKSENYLPINFSQPIDKSIKLYFSGVKTDNNGILKTKGGRVISMVCSGNSLYETINKIYNNIYKIQYDGVYFRRDIGIKRCIKDSVVNNKKLKIAIMGSTNGTSSQYLIEKQEELNIEIALILSNKKDAGILQKAKENNIPFNIINEDIVSELNKNQIDLIFLIGYMKIIKGRLLETYRNRIFNVHPSLLPNHGGLMDISVHESVISSGDITSGCTLHKVEEKVDCGSIILQKQIKVPKNCKPYELKNLVQELEKQSFVDFVNIFKRTNFFSEKITYESSGVSISQGNDFVDIIKTFNPGDNIGKFGGIYNVGDIKLCATTDGVGTKLEIARKLNKYDTIGIDLVAMCVNDLIVQGAEPLFFLDYIAVEKLNLEKCKSIIEGIIEGCKQAGCVLLGGETAEMPGVYKKEGFDLAGFSVGKIEQELPLEIKEGYKMYGLKSSGVHSNGYSLIRKILETHEYPNMDELIEPTIIYVDIIKKLKLTYDIKGLVHITGGGLIENIPRILPKNLSFNLEINWKIPDVFYWIKEKSDMTWEDMYRTYNCGIGMVVVLKDDITDENLIPIGSIISSSVKIN